MRCFEKLDISPSMFSYVYVEQRSPIAVSSPMSYIVVKTIKGKQYQYQQRTYREGGRVRTESIYIGPVGGGTRRKGVARAVGCFIRANMSHRRGLPDDETMLKEYNDKVAREKDSRDQALADLHSQFGLKMPDQITAQPGTSPADVSQEKAPSESTDGAKDQ
jgi:hypothetical protein